MADSFEGLGREWVNRWNSSKDKEMYVSLFLSTDLRSQSLHVTGYNKAYYIANR